MPNERDIDQAPPADIESEMTVIGSVLIKPDVLDALGFLREEDFHGAGHGIIYRRLCEMHAHGEPIEARSVLARLRAAGELEGIGGPAHLYECLQAAPHAHNAAYHARRIVRAAQHRGLIGVSLDMLRDAQQGYEDPRAIIERAERVIGEMEVGRNTDGPVPISEVVTDVLAMVERMQDRAYHLGVPTGLRTFDEEIGGLFNSELTILAARTSAGKTALACQIACEVAASGRLVYYASLEMPASTLVLRQACAISGVSLHRLRSRRMTDEECAALIRGLGQVAGGKLVLHDRPRMGVADVARSSRRLGKDALALIVVDYLQLLYVPPSKAQRYEKVGQLMHDLKALAGECGAPVLVLCQLSRAAEEEAEPELRHLRESGDIEQDADMVLMIHRPRKGLTEVDQRGKPVPGGLYWDADLLLRKNRNGPTGRFRLSWDPGRTLVNCWGDTAIRSF